MNIPSGTGIPTGIESDEELRKLSAAEDRTFVKAVNNNETGLEAVNEPNAMRKAAPAFAVGARVRHRRTREIGAVLAHARGGVRPVACAFPSMDAFFDEAELEAM